MRAVVRSNTRAVTILLSTIALGVVFAGVLRLVPPGPLPRNEALVTLVPHLNVAISLAAIGTISAGLQQIRAGHIANHRRFMLASTLLFASFLVLYIYKIILEGPTAFAGPEAVRQFVYLPLLSIHVLLAVIAVPLVIYVLVLASTHSIAELPETSHPRIGRLAAVFWLLSFGLGVVVYLLLYAVY
jgi:putative membrane protein